MLYGKNILKTMLNPPKQRQAKKQCTMKSWGAVS